jgi:hypothetical protein
MRYGNEVWVNIGGPIHEREMPTVDIDRNFMREIGKPSTLTRNFTREIGKPPTLTQATSNIDPSHFAAKYDVV